MFEYVEQAQSAVRRINYRIEKLSEIWGFNSSFVQEYTAKLDIHFPDNIRFKDGVMQLHHPAQIFDNLAKRNALEKLDKEIPTWQDIKKEWEEPYQEALAKEEFGQPIDFKQFVNVNENLDMMIATYADSNQMPSDALEIMKIQGRRKTYEELDTALTFMQRGELSDLPFADF